MIMPLRKFKLVEETNQEQKQQSTQPPVTFNPDLYVTWEAL